VARRVLPLTSSATQLREALSTKLRADVTGLEVTLREVPVNAAGERRGRGDKIPSDQVRTMRALRGRIVSSQRRRRCIKIQPGRLSAGLSPGDRCAANDVLSS
jgi:hypothetical protein